MIDKQTRERIITLIRREVVPAIGCTEPMAVALCTAKATEKLGHRPEKIEVCLSANVLKNAMGVGIPGTGMIGLPIAIAAGSLVGKSEYQLEVLKDLTPEALEDAKRYMDEGRTSIDLKRGQCDKLYIEVTCSAEGQSETAIIAGSHTNFVSGDASFNDSSAETDDGDIVLDMHMVFDFATTSPLDEIRFIDEARRLNMDAAREALKGNYGHNLGKTIDRPMAKGIFGHTIFSHIISSKPQPAMHVWRVL